MCGCSSTTGQTSTRRYEPPRETCRLDQVIQDREAGYTPLHIAAGYLHGSIVRLLLGAGADPEQADKQGRSPSRLVASLKENTPPSPEYVSRRKALDDVARARGLVLVSLCFNGFVGAGITHV